MIRLPPRSTQGVSSAASDVYKRQGINAEYMGLLLHKTELRKLREAIMQKGYTIVPLKIYFNAKGLAKIEIGLGKGKNIRDKREDLKDKAIKRDIEKELKSRSFQSSANQRERKQLTFGGIQNVKRRYFF
eukprot:TRINITY_DN58610_c0_g1_i2.p3 TRINITY_DN58610_c0_g1~~TRINITY_DN58610_c0_g1_i2.p3  ORF type:complete len:130 (+),score=21.70 TRINITY_DN58610_c0_g1_i2:96-485(+)